MATKDYRDAYVAAHVSNTIASQIGMLREKEGWTQKELAQRADMSQSRISALEDPNYENFEVGTLRRLASAFDVGLTVRFIPFSELVTWTAELSEHKLCVHAYGEDHAPGQIVSATAPSSSRFFVSMNDPTRLVRNIFQPTHFFAPVTSAASFSVPVGLPLVREVENHG